MTFLADGPLEERISFEIPIAFCNMYFIVIHVREDEHYEVKFNKDLTKVKIENNYSFE